MPEYLFYGVASGGPTLPTFPTLDLATQINWFVNGVTGIMASNAPAIIGAGVIIAAFSGAIWYMRRFGKKAVKG